MARLAKVNVDSTGGNQRKDVVGRCGMSGGAKQLIQGQARRCVHMSGHDIVDSRRHLPVAAEIVLHELDVTLKHPVDIT